MKKLIEELKENNQDKEFYPTTNEIIGVMKGSLKKDSFFSLHNHSMLDIGAGNGKVLNSIGFGSKFAIEQSQILIQNMDKGISVIGRDFRKNTLIDKEMDIIFSNPPYSEYSIWVNQIIKEANSKFIYLVIPTRWIDDNLIKQAIEQRGIRESDIDILGTFSFLDSEDRKARAEVNLVKIDLRNKPKTPFWVAMQDMFPDEIKRYEESLKNKSDKPKNKEKDKKFELVHGQNMIDHLLELYTKENESIYNSYKSILSLDSSILSSVGFDVVTVAKSLEEQMTSLKVTYWNILFDNFSKITDKLTSTSRRKVMEELNAGRFIDFNYENIHMVVIWVLKNANEYYDSQLVDLYKRLTSQESIRNFKSNDKVYNDKWRYNSYNKSMERYVLDTRIIIYIYEALGSADNNYSRYMGRDTKELMDDIFTVFNNLGFENKTPLTEYEETYFNGNTKKRFEYGEKYYFYLADGKPLLEMKFFKKGTIHLKFNQKALMAFNIEASRILGWVNTPKEASEEMGIDEKETSKFFMSNINLIKSDIKLLGI